MRSERMYFLDLAVFSCAGIFAITLAASATDSAVDAGRIQIAGHECLKETLDASNWDVMCEHEKQQLALLCDADNELRCACIDDSGYHWTYGEVCDNSDLWCIGATCPADE